MSMPGKPLLAATLLTVLATLTLPFSPLAALLGFHPIALPFLLALLVILILYVMTVEAVKAVFYRKITF